ncbi:MAG: SprT family zinc-dependent metalloprotease [Clostridiaceae bacterium]|nr:SprT family zinc-dependent metalloprotease [Clostridiaceae bacterium]
MKELMATEKLYALYEEFNTKYYNGKLPSNVTIEWSNRLTRSAGMCYPSKKIIRLSTHYHKKFPEEIGSTLLHEMIHLIILDHGPTFKKEIQRIEAMGGTVSRYAKEAAKLKSPSWKWVCTKCKTSYTRYRRGAKNYKCRVCNGQLKDKPIK